MYLTILKIYSDEDIIMPKPVKEILIIPIIASKLPIDVIKAVLKSCFIDVTTHNSTLGPGVAVRTATANR